MTSPIPKLTLDTNCIINLFDHEADTPTSVDALSELIKYGLSNKADIAVTTRVESDLSGDLDEERKKKMFRTLKQFPVVGTVMRWDTSRWDGGDVWSGADSEKLATEVQAILFPGLTTEDRHYKNKQMDVDHIVGHLINHRDVFVTDDKHILKRREPLRVSPGVVVMSPDECVAYLERMKSIEPPTVLSTETTSPEYRSPGLSGKVCFDYSNNNGSFVIGDGLALFETKWSKASRTAIHAYSDATSIDALALAKGVDAIKNIRDARSFDYSSRARSPAKGQIVLWRNMNGLYAATKVIDIRDDTRGDDEDELTLEYVILPNGSPDFAV
jgi:hypothetical protein